MRITIHHRLSEITEAGALALRRRAMFALGRFATRIEALSLRIRDVNGPRGGVGFSCLARVRLRRPATEIVGSADAVDPLLGAALALERARSGVARIVDRARSEGRA